MSSGYRNAAVAAHKGAAKKGGGGGKYTWGVPGLGDLNAPAVLDKNDPNYVADDEPVQHSAASSSSSAPKPKRKIEASHDDVIALDPQETYKQTCADIINEYFESEDVGEVANSLVELNHSVWNYEFVKQAVVLSFDKSNRERELVSYLFSSLYGSVLTSSNLLNGFRILLHRIEDFTLDVPEAPHLLGTFLARAVVDELLPPIFVRAKCTNEPMRLCLARATSLLDDGPSAARRLERCWDSEGSHMTVARLKQNFATLLNEYLDSGDQNEAERLLREMQIPDFHFEIVKQCVYLVLQRMKDADRDAIAKLVADMVVKSNLLSARSLEVGLRVAVDNVADLALDMTPKAPELLVQFINAIQHAGCTSVAVLAQQAPTLVADRLAEYDAKLAAFKETVKQHEEQEK